MCYAIVRTVTVRFFLNQEVYTICFLNITAIVQHDFILNYTSCWDLFPYFPCTNQRNKTKSRKLCPIHGKINFSGGPNGADTSVYVMGPLLGKRI